MNRTGLRKKDQQYETHQEIGIDIHAHLLLLDGLMGRSITKRTEGQKTKMWVRIKDFARHKPYDNVNEKHIETKFHEKKSRGGQPEVCWEGNMIIIEQKLEARG